MCKGGRKAKWETRSDYTLCATCDVYLCGKAQSQLRITLWLLNSISLRCPYKVLQDSSCFTFRRITPAWPPCSPAAWAAPLCNWILFLSPCPSPPPRCPSLPLLIPLAGRGAPPIQGSWGRICGAQPWSRLFTTRLNRPVWTAVRGQAASLWPHPCCCLLPPSTRLIIRPSIFSTYERASSFKAWEVCWVCYWRGGWGWGWGVQRTTVEADGWRGLACLCV